MGREAARQLDDAGHEVELIDLAEQPLPICDGGAAYGDPAVGSIARRIAPCTGLIVAAPIYNFDVNAALKNLLELTGRTAWTGKIVGFLAAAGGQGSYMSLMPFANSLMLDFRCVIVPRFVYALGDAFEGTEITDPKIQERIAGLVKDITAFCPALEPYLEKPAQA